ncbi:ATP-binding protein [Chloroflexi bacterium TSY]|nr:ATP-binding protein [Chloroflexi bacterium TSY]
MRFFNTTGPVVADDHYCIPPLTRFDLDEVRMLLQQKRYFVLHAPRQVGKTSYLLALADYLNTEGTYRCLYMNAEMGQAMRENVDVAIQVILGELSLRARDYLSDTFPAQIMLQVLETHRGAGALNELLTLWCRQSEKPIVLLIDEIDSLIGDTLISVLRQLRGGYDSAHHLAIRRRSSSSENCTRTKDSLWKALHNPEGRLGANLALYGSGGDQRWSSHHLRPRSQ